MATQRKVGYVKIVWDLLASYYPDSGTLNLNHLTETSITNLKSVDIVSPVDITLTFTNDSTIVCRVDSSGNLVATGYNFGKTLLVKGISLMDDELDVLKEYKAVTMGGVKIYFYTRTGKKNVVNKSTLLSNEEIILGDFTESFNVSELSLTLDYAIDVFNWTYCYIPQLKRYYFITAKESISKHFTRITLSVDVLYSFKSLILSQTNVMINRNETNYNGYLTDSKFPLENKQTIEYSVIQGGTLSNFNFTPNQYQNIVMTTANTMSILTQLQNEFMTLIKNGSNNAQVSTTTGTDFTSFAVAPYRSIDFISYKIDKNDLIDIVAQVFANDELNSYINNVISFPFTIGSDEIYEFPTTSSYEDNILKNGKMAIGLKDTLIKNTDNTRKYRSVLFYGLSKRKILFDKTFTKKFSGQLDFLNYTPFSSYQLYIPYYGWIDLNPNDILGNRILLYYSVNYLTGDGHVYLYNYTKQEYIFDNEVKIGVKIDIFSTNENALRQQEISNAVGSTLGVLSSVAGGIVTALVTQNPVAGAIAGASAIAVGTTTAIARGVTQANAIDAMKRFNTGAISSPNFGLYQEQRAILKHSFMNPIKSTTTYLSNYAKLYGLPYQELKDLSTLENSGYTETIDMNLNALDNRDITDNEINDINSLLNSGVYL